MTRPELYKLLTSLDPDKPFMLNHTVGTFQPGPYEPRHLPLILGLLEQDVKPVEKVNKSAKRS